MLARLLPPLSVACAVAACSSEVPETVTGGRVHQDVGFRRYSVSRALDVIIVMNTDRADGSLRAGVAQALRERVRELAAGDAPWLNGDLWNPVDVRAFVANAADGTLRTPIDTPALVWHEPNATAESTAAEAFTTAAVAELTRTPSNGPRSEGVVTSTLATALTAAATRQGEERAQRLIVIVSTQDDTSAPAVLDSMLRPEDDLVVVLPSTGESPTCALREAPHLEAWARASMRGSIMYPCTGIRLKDWFVDYASACIFRGAARAKASHTSCRVRAFVPAGTRCDAVRGWRSLDGASPEPISDDLDLAGGSVCEVVALQGEDERSCREDSRYSGAASGWCLPAPTPSCATPPPRLVAGSAPPWATIETVCNLVDD